MICQRRRAALDIELGYGATLAGVPGRRHTILAGLVAALMGSVMGVACTKPPGASASGVIREIDRASSRVEIDHGPIPSIGMPGMTMTFKVRNPALLEQVKQGDPVNFEIEQSGLGWIITNLNRK